MKSPKSLFGRKRGPIELGPTRPKRLIPRILPDDELKRIETAKLVAAMLAANTRKSLGSATTWEAERVWP